MNPPLVQLLPQKRQIRIGSTCLGCDPGPDGSLIVEGVRIRPLTVGERDQAVAHAGRGAGGARNLALLVWQTAAPTGGVPAKVSQAALEAVALHLAGASMRGGLSRTILLVAKALGAAPHAALAMPALQADRLAEAIAASLGSTGESGAGSNSDGGWTVLSLGPPESDANHAPGSTPSLDFCEEVRDRLAARLAARALDGLDGVLGELVDRPAQRTAIPAFSSNRPAERDATPVEAARGRPADRGGSDPASLGRWDPKLRRCASPAEEPDRDRPAAGAFADVSADEDRWVPSSAVARSPGAAAFPGVPPGSDSPSREGRAFNRAMVAPAAPWSATRPASEPGATELPLPGSRRSGLVGTPEIAGFEVANGIRPLGDPGRSPVGTRNGAEAGEESGSKYRIRPTARPHTETGLDTAAVILHRVADLRGVPR